MENKYYELDKLKSLPLDKKIRVIEDIISAPIVYESNTTSALPIESLPLRNTSEKSNKNETCCKKVGLFLLFLIFTFNSFAQTIDDVAIGQILDSMPGGITLRDGTVLKAEVINLGTASTSYPDHGIYNQYDFGGVYNGVVSSGITTTGPDGLTLAGYSGNKDPLLFTRISATPRQHIDQGEATNFNNAIGFHFWADRPILAKELLLIDCDGANDDDNQEWFTMFGYNGTTAVNPTVSLNVGTELIQGLETVNSSWHTMVDAKILGVVPSFTQKILAKNNRATSKSFSDPDDLDNQALFDFGTSKVDHLFVLWGIRGDLTGVLAGAQNSGVSPLVFSFDFDYGDAPNSYGTNKASKGPVHLFPDTGPRLRLGSAINTENNGSPSPLANSHIDDDGISTVDSILRRPAFPTDTIGSYSLVVSYNNPTGNAANYVAWIDWNNNGVFNAGEGRTATTAASSASGTVTFTWTNQIMTNHIATDHTYARIRVTTESITTANDKNSPFQDGEVEDYYIPFSDAGLGPLPVHLLSYDVKTEDAKVQLNWVVADQKDVDRYEIHRSNNGINFNKIGLLKADKNKTQYSLWDNEPQEGLNLYQLRSIDIDGKHQYAANILKVDINKNKPKATFYPNPSSNTISVNTSAYQNLLELKVFNITGQQIMHQSLNKGLNNIDVSSLINGTYYFELMNGTEQVYSEKIQITK